MTKHQKNIQGIANNYLNLVTFIEEKTQEQIKQEKLKNLLDSKLIKDKLRDQNFNFNSLSIVKHFSQCQILNSEYDAVQKETVYDSFKFRKNGENQQFDFDNLHKNVKCDKNFRYKVENKIDLFNSQLVKRKRRTSHDLIAPSEIQNNYLANTTFKQIHDNEINENLLKYKQYYNLFQRLELKLNTLSLLYSKIDKKLTISNSQISFAQQGCKQTILSSQELDVNEEQMQSIRGVYKCHSDELDGTITLNPVDVTNGRVSMNLKLAINEEIYKFNFLIGDQEKDKIIKYRLWFRDDNLKGIFDKNKEIVEDMIQNIFRQTQPTEIVQALQKINQQWWSVNAYWIPSKKSIQLMIGDYGMSFECKKNISEPGVEEQYLIEGIYECSKSNQVVELEIVNNGNKQCQVKISIKYWWKIIQENLHQYNQRYKFKINLSQQDFFQFKNTNAIEKEFDKLNQEKNEGKSKGNNHKKKNTVSLTLKRLMRNQHSAQPVFGCRNLDIRSKNFKKVITHIIIIKHVFDFMKGIKSLELPPKMVIQQLMTTNDQVEIFNELFQLYKQSQHFLAETYNQFKLTYFTKLKKLREKNALDYQRLCMNFALEINKEHNQLFKQFYENKFILDDNKVLAEMKRVFNRFIFNTQFGPNFGIQEDDEYELKNVTYKFNQYDEDTRKNTANTLAAITRKTTRGGKFKSEIMMGEFKYKHEVQNKKQEPHYTHYFKDWHVEGKPKNQISWNKKEITNVSKFNNEARSMITTAYTTGYSAFGIGGRSKSSESIGARSGNSVVNRYKELARNYEQELKTITINNKSKSLNKSNSVDKSNNVGDGKSGSPKRSSIFKSYKKEDSSCKRTECKPEFKLEELDKRQIVTQNDEVEQALKYKEEMLKKEQRIKERNECITGIYGSTKSDFKRFKVNMGMKKNKSMDLHKTLDKTLDKTETTLETTSKDIWENFLMSEEWVTGRDVKNNEPLNCFVKEDENDTIWTEAKIYYETVGWTCTQIVIKRKNNYDFRTKHCHWTKVPGRLEWGQDGKQFLIKKAL